eukprot:352298-Chlamydomonas_euryale.AAC.3
MEEQLNQEHSQVERVFRQKANDGSMGSKYLVKWVGLPYAEATWEDEAELVAAGGQEQVRQYQGGGAVGGAADVRKARKRGKEAGDRRTLGPAAGGGGTCPSARCGRAGGSGAKHPAARPHTCTHANARTQIHTYPDRFFSTRTFP